MDFLKEFGAFLAKSNYAPDENFYGHFCPRQLPTALYVSLSVVRIENIAEIIVLRKYRELSDSSVPQNSWVYFDSESFPKYEPK